MSTLSAATLAAIGAAVAEAVAAAIVPVSAPVDSSEASAHWKARDLSCRVKACKRAFRTSTGRDWHEANMHKAAAK